MARWFVENGHDAVHTLDLPLRNRTPDGVVAATADAEDRIVVTKDSDFVDSHLLRGTPAKLLLISTGNVANDALQTVILALISAIDREFQTCRFIEVGTAGMTVRG